MLGKRVGLTVGTTLVAVATAVAAPGAAAHGPGMALEDVDEAFPAPLAPGSSASIKCVSANRRFAVVYARPRDRASRFEEVLPSLVQAVYDASALWDREAIRQRPDSRARFRVACDGARPAVREVALRTPETRDTASTVLSDLWHAGLDDGSTKYLVYFDGCVPISGSDPRCHPGGVASVRSDDRPSAENLNNFGPSYAVDLGGDRPPSAFALAHGAGHAMGAVQPGAPYADGNWHCTDALDLMCPRPPSCENGAPDPEAMISGVKCVVKTVTWLRCKSQKVDCGNDTYFDARVGPSEYLRRHWNIAAAYNGFLDHGPRVLDRPR